jgi:hypothetical protein
MLWLRCIWTIYAWAHTHAAETWGDLPVCADSSTDTAANHLSTWLQLITLHVIRLVRPSTFTEAHETEYEQSLISSSLDAPLVLLLHIENVFCLFVSLVPAILT